MLDKLLKLNEFGAVGLYEEPDRGLFYRKALGLRRFYENCDLPEYRGDLLYPSGDVRCPYYYNGLAVDFSRLDDNLVGQIKGEFCQFISHVPYEHTVAGDMFTHSMPNYERIIKEGFNSYIPRIKKIEDKDMREGLLNLVEGIKTYLKRCTDYLESVQAEQRLIAALRQVPMFPARNIYEAVVGWNFVMYLDGCDNLGCVASGLLPYYNGEDITDLLKNLFDNIDAKDGYSMALHTDYNPLTLQCLEASKGKRRPMIELFVDENTPSEVWEKAFEVIRTSNGQPAFYNPSALLGGLLKRIPRISDEDINKFCGGGCTESMIAGFSNVGSLDAGINLLLLLENTIYNDIENSASFEEFYERYIDIVRETVDIVTESISKSQIDRARLNPVPMRTLLIDDCIDNGIEYNSGGARYKWSIINFAGIINVIDSLLVIKDLVFGGKVSPAEFKQKLKSNDKEFLQILKNHPVCFGIDNPVANDFSKKLTTDVFSMLDDKKPAIGEAFLPSSIQFRAQVGAGSQVGATPDGREAYSPLCDSLGAIFSKDINGPTSLLNSVSSLDLGKALGTPVLSFNVNSNFDNEILKSLILGYMQQGGIQIQITCISRETLEDAYKNPENYKNLVVRVGGYSEYFYRLNDELKRMIVARTIQNEV